MIEIAIIGIIIALIFDFVNGFNDSANSVAYGDWYTCFKTTSVS